MLKDVTKAVKGNNAIMTVLGLGMIVAICIILWNVYKAFKKGAGAAGDAMSDGMIAAIQGLPLARVVHIRGLGADLWNTAVDQNWAFQWLRNYDEDLFILAINECQNDKEIGVLNEAYKEKSGESLASVINSSFSTNEKARIRRDLVPHLK